MLQKLSDEYGVEIIILSTGDCVIADLLRPGIRKSKQCVKHTDKIMAKIESAASDGDIIFLASLRMNRFVDQWALFSDKSVASAQHSKKSLSDRKAALKETEYLLKRLEALHVYIIIDAPKPIFNPPPFGVLTGLINLIQFVLLDLP